LRFLLQCHGCLARKLAAGGIGFMTVDGEGVGLLEMGLGCTLPE
jgi:hypothetical protein